MKHVVAIRADVYDELGKKVESKLQELQAAGNNIVNVSMGGRMSDSGHDWVALILYEEK